MSHLRFIAFTEGQDAAAVLLSHRSAAAVPAGSGATIK